MGKHICLYYGSNEDLIGYVSSFFKEGLSNNMLCSWVVPPSLGIEEAKITLGKKIEDLNRYIEKGQFELLDHKSIYLKGRIFNGEQAMQFWAQKEQDALKQGFEGLQVSGDASWLREEDWFKLVNYEKAVNETIAVKKIVALCTFPLGSFDAFQLLSLSHSHNSSIRMHDGIMDVIKS